MTSRPLRAHILIDSLTWGGAEALLGDLAAGAPAADIELSVGYLKDIDDSPSARRLRALGIEPTLLDCGRLIDRDSLRRVRAHLRSTMADVVHTHLQTADVLGGLAARSLRMPSVSTIHLIGPAASDAPGPRGALKSWLTAIVRRSCQARIIAVSDAARGAYLDRFHERPERVVTVHNGVAAPQRSRSRDAMRAELGIAGDAIALAIVTVLREGKGHDVAVRAIERLLPRNPQLLLLIVGDGPDRARIAELAAGLGRHALLTGHRHDIADVLGAVDVLLHPTRMDAFPTILLEACAAGLPVLATAVGGIPEIVVDGRNGLLVPAPPSAESVSTALERLLSDPELRERMGAEARDRFAREFSAEQWAIRLRAVYEEIRSATVKP